MTLSGTDLDPQGLDDQRDLLEKAGAKVFLSSDRAVRYTARMIQALAADDTDLDPGFKSVDLESVNGPFAAINVGLESFTESLMSQEADVIQVDWSPAAGGDADLAALLEKMKR